MSFMLLILASCMQEEEMKQDTTFSGVLVKRTFSTTVAQDTKVSLADDNGAIQWSEGDEISIWDGVANRKFTLVSRDGSSAVFEGYVDEAATDFFAVSP